MIAEWKTKMTTHRRVGMKIREYRSKYGLTQGALAKSIGCHPSSISALETGRAASMELLEGTLWAMGLDMTALRLDHQDNMISLERARRMREEKRAQPIFRQRRQRRLVAVG